jgi:tetratricopeptide (TPR) repeat protein
MLTGVADERVAAIPQMREVRQSLLKDAAAFYTDLIELNPDDARAYHERGWVYNMLGQYDGARADFERAAEMEPDNAEYHGTLGTLLCYQWFRDAPRGLHHARRMVELRPTDAEARGILASAYLSAGQKEEGMAELQKGAELARGTALEHKLLAAVEQAVGNWRNVIAHLEQVRELPPPDLWVYYHLADAHRNLGEDAQALAAIERGLELGLRPSDEPAGPSQLRGRWRGIVAHSYTSRALGNFYRIRGEIHVRQGKHEAALAAYSNLLDVDPNRFSRLHSYNVRGFMHFCLGHFEQALADVTRAVELDPDGFTIVSWTGPSEMAYCPDEKFRAGILALADRAIDRARRKANGYGARGCLYAELKQYGKARADFEKAVELGMTEPCTLSA